VFFQGRCRVGQFDRGSEWRPGEVKRCFFCYAPVRKTDPGTVYKIPSTQVHGIAVPATAYLVCAKCDDRDKREPEYIPKRISIFLVEQVFDRLPPKVQRQYKVLLARERAEIDSLKRSWEAPQVN
jgi:hypothetical protein